MKEKISNFPLQVMRSWLDRLGEAVKHTEHESKHDFIIEAVNEKMDEVLGKKDK